MALDLTLGQGVVLIEQQPPRIISELGGATSRVDDVGEKDASQHAIRFGH
jgi:hypothetical protein